MHKRRRRPPPAPAGGGPARTTRGGGGHTRAPGAPRAAPAASARAAAEVALADQDVDAGGVNLRLTCLPVGDCLAPGSVVRVEVRTQVRLPLVPTALGDGAPSIRVDARHTVPYGTFREDRS